MIDGDSSAENWKYTIPLQRDMPRIRVSCEILPNRNIRDLGVLVCYNHYQVDADAKPFSSPHYSRVIDVVANDTWELALQCCNQESGAYFFAVFLRFI